MKQVSFDALDDSDRELIKSASKAMLNAYAPYSNFAVGSAVLTGGGSIYNGANMENAVYGLGVCAEVSAIMAANAAEGDSQMPTITTIAVVGGPVSNPRKNLRVVTPCGRCRQVILEAAQAVNHDIRVLSCSGDMREVLVSTISELLPSAFGADNLSEAGKALVRDRLNIKRRS